MQAIETKNLGPTVNRNNRIKASCARGSVTVDCDDIEPGLHFGSEQAHRAAAFVLMDKFHKEDTKQHGPEERHWLHGKTLYSGCLPSGHYCHVIG